MIKHATRADLPFLMYLCEQMHNESPRFGVFPFSDAKVSKMLRAEIVNPDSIVLVSDNGMLLATVQAMIFGDTLGSNDKLFYVEPGARGTMQAARLVKEYIAEAKRRGVVDIGIGNETETKGRVEDLYLRLGFRRTGGNFVLG